MKAEDLRNMEIKELMESRETLEEKLFHIRFQSVTEEIQSPSEIKYMRRDIARIKTVIRQKELAQDGKNKDGKNKDGENKKDVPPKKAKKPKKKS